MAMEYTDLSSGILNFYFNCGNLQEIEPMHEHVCVYMYTHVCMFSGMPESFRVKDVEPYKPP